MANAANTQDLVEIKEIRDNTVVQKNGTICKVVIVGGINFALKSEAEQATIIEAYQNFLNSINFPVQIIIHSRKVNIGPYLNFLEERQGQEQSPILRDQINEYKEFISKFIETNAIMAKTFLVVIPFTPVQIPGSGGVFSSLFGKSDKSKAEIDEKDFVQHVQQLDQRVNQATQGLANIGLEPQILNTEQLVELFYNFYNPETVEKESLNIKE